MKKIALTGVTGNLGGIVSRLIMKKGIKARHLARNTEKAIELGFKDVFKASYDNSGSTIKSLEGVDVLFMVSGSESLSRVNEHKGFIDAAEKAGVRHIVYTSFYNATLKSIFTLGRDHAETESYIKDKGFIYTFIRDNFYMDFFVDMCLNYNEIKGPAGNGKVSAVTRHDIAEVIAQILMSSEKWENRTLNMTGPEELTMAEITQAVSRKTGKDIKFVNETLEEAYESRRAWKAEDWEYDAWVSTYTAIAEGEQAGISDDIEKVLGRKAVSLNEYLDSIID